MASDLHLVEDNGWRFAEYVYGIDNDITFSYPWHVSNDTVYIGISMYSLSFIGKDSLKLRYLEINEHYKAEDSIFKDIILIPANLPPKRIKQKKEANEFR
jgi:hypothetical protein